MLLESNMGKRVAQHIIDILEDDESDLKKFHERVTTDWKYLFHKDMKQEILENVNHYYKSTNLRYNAYCNLYDIRRNQLLSPYETNEENESILKLYSDKHNHPDIIWSRTKRPVFKVTHPKLQEIIDYCRSLDFKIYGRDDYGSYFITLDWKHWVKNKNKK